MLDQHALKRCWKGPRARLRLRRPFIACSVQGVWYLFSVDSYPNDERNNAANHRLASLNRDKNNRTTGLLKGNHFTDRSRRKAEDRNLAGLVFREHITKL